MKKCFAIKFVLPVLVAFSLVAGDLGAKEVKFHRFYFIGDGTIYLVNPKNGASFHGIYRTGANHYGDAALRAINHVFGAEYGVSVSTVSVRLIEFLDFLQDRLHPGAKIIIISGWRSPEYNRRLRNRGGLVAKASLHQYGMAADVIIEGVSPERLWNYVRKLGYGGAGYYHGKMVHVDVGPARWWDEKTSGVHTHISDHNKLIELITNYDYYLPGETIVMRFIRMTAFPVGVVPEMILEMAEKGGTFTEVTSFKPVFAFTNGDACLKFTRIDQMLDIHWNLPSNIAAGRYRIRSLFCDRSWSDMPISAVSPPFQVVRR